MLTRLQNSLAHKSVDPLNICHAAYSDNVITEEVYSEHFSGTFIPKHSSSVIHSAAEPCLV